jgi:hypothetical protein
MARKEKQAKPEHWDIPDLAKIQAGLRYFYERPRTPAKLTLPFVLFNPSGRKLKRLREAHIHATDLRGRILEQWQDDWQKPRQDGALAHILSVQDKGHYKSRTFGEIVRKRFAQDSSSAFISRFHEGICRDCAQDITGWAQKVIKLAVEDYRNQQRELQKAFGEPRKKLPTYAPTLEDVYRAWARRERAYHEAAERLIRFGRNAGDSLEKHGKREARWLLERLLPDDEIIELLEDVDRLLDETPSVLQSEAAMIEHPWLRTDDPTDEPQHQRAVREGHLMQRIFQPRGEFVLLGQLRKEELAILRKVLKEMLSYSEAFKTCLQQFQAALAETHDMAYELKGLQETLETFLASRPYSYPTILNREWSEAYQQQAQETLETWLNWFFLNNEKPERVERFLNVQLEANSRDGLARAISAVKPPKWQPISFAGTMYPRNYRDFALLYERRRYQLTLAVILHKKGTFGKDYEPQHREETSPNGRKAQRDYAKRRADNPLYYVNFPETPFCPPKGTAVLLFPLSYGYEYHSKIIHTIISHQRTAQRRLFAELNRDAEKPIPIEKCLPKALVNTAKILCDWDEHGKQIFTANITMEPPVSELPQMPIRVIGFHEHDSGYSYAILELDGTVCSVGDVRLAQHVDPSQGSEPNGDNYVYDCANKIVAKAALWEAFIGIEDTTYKKQQPSLSRQQNRKVFSRPSGRIIEATTEKARLKGMLDPRAIANIAPSRDCAQCRSRQPDTGSGVSNEYVVRCPLCKQYQQYVKEDAPQRCATCGYEWPQDALDSTKERLFSCTICRSPARLARHNTAIVVAQRTLIALVQHYENALKAEERRKKEQENKAAKSQG